MKKFFAFIVVMLFILSGSFVWADATIVTTFKSDGFRGVGAMASTQTRQYQGEKMNEKSTSQFTGAVLSFLTSATENVIITRVDKGVSWALDTKNKTYTETPIQPIKLSRETPQGREEKPKAKVTKSEITVKKTGASETINGFPCQEYLVTWLMEIENLETREKAQNVMETRLWTTPVTSTIQKAQADEQRYTRALMKKMGMEISAQDARMMGAAMMGSMMSESDMKKGMVKVKNEIAKIKGYPIRTVVNWSMEGGNSGVSAGKKAESEERSAPASGGFGGLVSGVMGSLGMNKSEQKAEEKGSSMFSSTMEVKSIEADSVPAGTFEIPGGYVKKGE